MTLPADLRRMARRLRNFGIIFDNEMATLEAAAAWIENAPRHSDFALRGLMRAMDADVERGEPL